MLFKLRTLVSLAIVFGATAALPAHAQQPAAEAPTVVAPMSCPDPGNPPLDRTGAEGPRFQKRLDTYRNCVQAYSQLNTAKGNALLEQSRAYTDAANKAVDEFNAYIAANKLNGK